MGDSPRIDPIVTLAAVEQNGLALACAARELQEDRTIVLAAVRQNGHALMYAATKLRSDLDIVLAALSTNPASLSCAAYSIRSHPEVSRVLGEANTLLNESIQEDHGKSAESNRSNMDTQLPPKTATT